MKRIAFLLGTVVLLSIGCGQPSKNQNAEQTPNTPEVQKDAATTSGMNEQPVQTASSGNIVFIEPKKSDGNDKTFQDIISEFKGKVVYVDFWATWCGPCRMQFPYTKEIHKKLEGKDVVFLYISFDRTEDAWRNGVQGLELVGYHHYPNDNQRMLINNEFAVNSIPRYMLIDKQGKIVDANAKRPSTEGQLQEIEALLK